MPYGLLGLFAAFFAERQVVLDRNCQGLLQLGNGLALERDHVAQAYHSTVEDFGFWVVLATPSYPLYIMLLMALLQLRSGSRWDIEPRQPAF